MSDLSIIELHKGDNRFFVSLHGGRTGDIIGVNLHKRYIEETILNQDRSFALDPYRESERTLCPTFSTMTPMLYPSVFHAFPRLVLPFTDDTSEGGPNRIDRFVTWIGSHATQRYDAQTLCAGLQGRANRSEQDLDRLSLTVLPV